MNDGVKERLMNGWEGDTRINTRDQLIWTAVFFVIFFAWLSYSFAMYKGTRLRIANFKSRIGKERERRRRRRRRRRGRSNDQKQTANRDEGIGESLPSSEESQTSRKEPTPPAPPPRSTPTAP